MKKILILMGRYLPGHKDGGPLRTIVNLTEALGDEYEFYIACLDRDNGDTEAYPNIQRHKWNKVGKAKVWYVPPKGFTNKVILNLAKDKDFVYLCSFFEDYGYKTLLLKKRKKINCPVALASMGVFSREALSQKKLKKKIFITGCKAICLLKNITWSVTSELEAEDVKRVIGKGVKYIVAEDLPRNIVPGRTIEYNGKIRVCFLSRICEHKGLDIAIDAMEKITDKTNLQFTIYGPIQEKEYWSKCQQKLKASNLNWLYGGDVPSEKVQECLMNQDVMLFPSKSENYGHVVFEALSVGCIPIVSDRTPWSMLEEYNAGYIASRNVDAFFKALRKYIDLGEEKKKYMLDAAVSLAKYKVEQSKKETGYRKIFEMKEI